MSDDDFARIAKVAKAGWGLHLEKSKQAMIQSRLARRLKALALPDFATYCGMIEAGSDTEKSFFIQAITTNVTHFYREKHHFEMLEGQVLPPLLDKARKGEKIRIWSAGCSSGQEPYSIAGSILSLDSSASKLDVKILATDIDEAVLQKAQSGVYDARDCTFPSAEYERRVFPRENTDTGQREVREALRKMVTFRQLNLFGEWPFSGVFDLIMCRNVAIYFAAPEQNLLWQRFAKVLVPQGHLFIGHSERINTAAGLPFEAIGTTAYRSVKT